ncbi:hypothetical protein [Formosa algae]|uniref:Uncharacterized protein n=1 Tax=Formosa algae TaxID=225843 RepID=A0A9X0YKQ4_9FLAO|nr:hypothetical protein [Formosa algae]MBP1839009.1 hypothetical protein [Formosa algae]MDQ0333786.1 hypothetical protein [Formosa algae]
MKNIYKTFCLLALSGIVFTSCEDGDDHTGESLIEYTNVGATVSSASQSYTVSESDIHTSGDYTIPYTVTLNEAVTATTIIDLIQTGGEADSEDYETSSITVSPGNTTGTGYITVFSNAYVEGTETLELTAKSRANLNINDYSIDITIDDDYINDQLDFQLTWEGSFTGSVGTGADLVLDFCAMDFDILIYDETLTDVGFYNAATGSCPESATLSGLPDGFYYVVVDLYDNPLYVYEGGIDVPITFSWSQDYFDSVTGSITLNAYNTDSTSGTYAIATITIEDGYIYTVQAY